MSNKFYCYSKRLFYFIKSIDVDYISFGINKNTNTKYYIFEKSEKLDKIIDLYNEIKHGII